MMTVAKGRCTSDPKLVASDAGNSPRMATSEVIRPGRRRSIRPLNDGFVHRCPSRRCLLIPLNISTPSMMAMPNSVAKPDAGRDIEVHVAEVQGHRAAGEGEGNRQQQDESPPETSR